VQIGVRRGVRPHLGEDGAALRVIGGPAPHQHQPAVAGLADQPEGPDQPRVIRAPLVGGDGQQDGLVLGTPSRSRICRTSPRLRSRFFSLRGSMEGYMISVGTARRCANFGSEKTAAS